MGLGFRKKNLSLSESLLMLSCCVSFTKCFCFGNKTGIFFLFNRAFLFRLLLLRTNINEVYMKLKANLCIDTCALVSCRPDYLALFCDARFKPLSHCTTTPFYTKSTIFYAQQIHVFLLIKKTVPFCFVDFCFCI